MRPYRLLSLYCLVALGTLGCASQSPDGAATAAPEARRSELRVGISPDYPPLAFKDGGTVRGVEPDLARALAHRLGVELVLVETPWEDLIPNLQQGRIDVIMSGMSVTEERSREVSFVQPYLQVGQMALIREQDAARLASPAALYQKGVRVGVVEQTTGELFARQELEQAQVVALPSIEAGVAALRAGHVDFFIHDAPTVWRLSTGPAARELRLIGLFHPLTEEYLAWAVSKSDESLRQRLDQAVSAMELDGTLPDVLNRWIPTRVEVGPQDDAAAR